MNRKNGDDSTGHNNRDLSTEQFFDLNGGKERRLQEEQEQLGQRVQSDEELSLQNIFLEKGDVPTDQANTAGGNRADTDAAAAALDKGEDQPQAPLNEASANSSTAAGAEPGASVAQDDDEEMLNADLPLPVLLTAVDLLGAAGAGEIQPDSLRVDADFGTIFDNGDNTWTFRPGPEFSGGPVPFSFIANRDGAATEIESSIDIVVDEPPMAVTPPAEQTAPPAANEPEPAPDTPPTVDTPPVDTTTEVLQPISDNRAATVGEVDLGATNEDSAITITSEALLANAHDLDGDELSVTQVSVSEEFGTLIDNGDGSWTFNPTENYNGDDVSFEFTVSDGIHSIDSTASLDVIAVNDGPVVEAVELGSTAEDTAITISSADLLAGASDVDGDALSVTTVSVAEEFGTITENGNGTWTFNPAENFNGDDVPIAFSVSDGTETVDSSASLNVTAVNDGPTVEKVDLGSTAEDTAIKISSKELLAGASDVDGDTLTVVDVSVAAEYGTVTNNGDGSWTFSPTENFNGDDVPLSFTVSDGSEKVESTASLNVSAVNDGPVVESVSLGSTAPRTRAPPRRSLACRVRSPSLHHRVLEQTARPPGLPGDTRVNAVRRTRRAPACRRAGDP